MKKTLSVFILFLSACSFVQTYDTEFKNPVFYQPLDPLPKTLGYVYLTPTSIDIRKPNNKNTSYQKGKCQLVENKEDFIKLLCHINWLKNEEMLEFSRYVLSKTVSPSKKDTYEKYLHLFSGDYYEDMYYTYTIKEPFIDNCVNIEQNVYEIKEEYIGKVSSAHFCTPPLKE